MNGLIFDIQKFSINDGPGIRTTIFLKGCPLDCLWCHNPESKEFKPQLSFNSKKCTFCGKCEAVCAFGVHKVTPEAHEVNYNNCTLCGKCVKACPSGALTIFGKSMSVSEVMDIVLKDINYYRNSDGGITISGGEPMAQFEFTYELCQEARKMNVNVAIETSGFARTEHFDKISDYIDVFLFDYKATGEELHKSLTGVDRKLIEQNFQLLLKKNSKIILRCPIIPNYNLSDEHLETIAEIGNLSENIIRVELLPYHNFGSGKAKQIGKSYDLATYMPKDEEVNAWIEFLKAKGLNKVYRG